MSNTKVAVWSVNKNRAIKEMETTVRPTKDPSVFAAQKGKVWLPVHLVEDNLELPLDEIYKYVYFE